MGQLGDVAAWERVRCERTLGWLQIQGLASGIGTFLGTCIRIPCEVLKQRLQTGRHANMLEAVAAATRVDGPRGLFRGTAATLSREVPFYVLGIVFFEQLKRAAKGRRPCPCSLLPAITPSRRPSLDHAEPLPAQ